MADQAKPSAMSLYADLLDGDKKNASAAVIASAPVRYNMKSQEAPAPEDKKKDGAYQIPAYLRPQIQNKKAKPIQSTSTHKAVANLSSTASVVSSPPKPADDPTTQSSGPAQTSKFEDWVGREDEDITYQRSSWNSRRKNKKKKENTRVWTWDDIYDPSQPNNYADYKNSDEQFAEIRDWKARLYYHQLRDIKKEKKQQQQQKQDLELSTPRNPMFAPPSNLNFAPPSFEDAPKRPSSGSSDDDFHQQTAVRLGEHARAPLRPVAFAASTQVPDSEPESAPPFENPANGADSHVRDVQLTSNVPMHAVVASNNPPPPPPSSSSLSSPAQTSADDFRSAALAKAAAIKAKLDASIKAAKETAASSVPGLGGVASAESLRPLLATTNTAQQPQADAEPTPSEFIPLPPPPPDVEQSRASTVSRAPVRYSQAPVELQQDDSSKDSDMPQPSSRPGQKNFAQRYMQKFGYEKGKGLGAQGEGIVTPIIMKAEKRKKRSDAEGGGWAVPANMGKIVGGKKRKLDSAEEEAEMSPVIKISGMVNGMDINHEMQENNLMQRIGDSLSQNHGNIERIFIWGEAMGGDDSVFVKFNSAVSALGAVNRAGGILFAGNTVKAVFYDAERFEKGGYA